MTEKRGLTIDEDKKIVTIEQPEFVLKQSSLLPGYNHFIYATTVRIAGDCSLPGCDLQVTAATINVPPKGAVLNTSGSDGKGFAAGDRNSAVLAAKGLNGKGGADGQDGEDGQDGGVIYLSAGRILGGQLSLISNGGKGGRAQDGGNGDNAGKVIDGSDAPFPQVVQTGTMKVEAGHNRYKTVPVYGWGDDVWTIGESKGNGAYLRKAHEAQHGPSGGNGGNAGLAGKPGDGGSGGGIFQMTLASPASAVKATARAGKAGGTAKHGKPGKLSKGGKGGRYMFNSALGFIIMITNDWSFFEDKRWKGWIGSEHFKNLGVGKEHLTSDGKQLIERAPSGKDGKNGGYGAKGAAKAPAIPNARDGNARAPLTSIITRKTKPSKNIQMSYLISLQRSATIEIANRDSDTAQHILEWLIHLTSDAAKLPASAVTPDFLQKHQMYNSARQMVMTLGRDDMPYAKANVYADIGDYTDFVKDSLALLEKQQNHLTEFVGQVENGKRDKAKLRNAIRDSKAQQEHLIGSVMEAGSINFLANRESDLKASIRTLDISIFNLRLRLGQMDTDLRSEINRKYHERTKITLQSVLDVTMLAIGIGMSVYSFGSSLTTVLGTVKKFYQDEIESHTWTDILKGQILTSTFTELKEDLFKLLETKEWEQLTKDSKAFVKTAVDFAAKTEAYVKLLNSRQKVKSDILDVQATILTYDTAKLQLRRQRAQLEKDLHKLLDDFEAAREWKFVFEDYFHTCSTRFDNLAHLAEIQAARREAEFQLNLAKQNEAALQAELDRAEFNPNSVDTIEALESMRSNQAMAIEQGLTRVLDLGRAYRAWSLKDHAFPKITKNLTSSELSDRFNAPLWKIIRLHLSKYPARSDKTFDPFVVPRSLFPAETDELKAHCFDKEMNAWRFHFSVPFDDAANIHHLRLIDAKAWLRGVTVAEDSEFYCHLIHQGASTFLDSERETVRTLQVPRRIAYSHTMQDGKPVFGYKGAVNAKFDDPDNKKSIRYSPYANWELRLIPNHRLLSDGKAYNKRLNFRNFDGIELSFSAFFNGFA